MKNLIFTICLLCLLFVGCSNGSARRKSRLEFSRGHLGPHEHYTRQEYYMQYYPQSVSRMGIPRVKPMELPPEKPAQ